MSKVSSETTASSMCNMRFLPNMSPPNVLVQSNPQPRMPSGMSLLAIGKTLNGRMINGRQRSMRRLKVRKEREEALSPRANLKGRLHRGLLLQGRHSSSPTKNERSQPKPKPEARSCMTNDFLFAMMNTKSKPTWRHSTWDEVDYMICTVAEPQRKLPVFRTGKWSLLETRKIFLYGHDAKTMKTFKLYFDSNDQCDTLDRAWFGEMPF